MKYEVRVKYARLDPNSGKEKVVTENYIIADAETWADAEQQLYAQMAKITGHTIAKAIKISDVVEIVSGDGDYFYKVKVGIITIDEAKGVEKLTKETILVRADHFAGAFEETKDWMETCLVPCEILGITKSAIVDIFDENFVPSTKIFIATEEDEDDDEDN